MQKMSILRLLFEEDFNKIRERQIAYVKELDEYVDLLEGQTLDDKDEEWLLMHPDEKIQKVVKEFCGKIFTKYQLGRKLEQDNYQGVSIRDYLHWHNLKTVGSGLSEELIINSVMVPPKSTQEIFKLIQRLIDTKGPEAKRKAKDKLGEKLNYWSKQEVSTVQLDLSKIKYDVTTGNLSGLP